MAWRTSVPRAPSPAALPPQFTFTSFYSYLSNTKLVTTAFNATGANELATETEVADPLYIMVGLVGMFVFIYIGGCTIAAREAGLFVHRFREKATPTPRAPRPASTATPSPDTDPERRCGSTRWPGSIWRRWTSSSTASPSSCPR
jgi:hypothetical protein